MNTPTRIDSTKHLNGHADRYDAAVLREENAALISQLVTERRRGNEWRDRFIGAAFLALFLLGVLVLAGWRL